MQRNKLLLGILCLTLFLIALPIAKAEGEVVFSENFELGGPGWSADNGVWVLGTPTAGPPSAHGGFLCAGTVLDGDYPAYTDSRFISPWITLPEVSGYEEIHLRFWQWFSYSSYDGGYVQISVYDEATQTWSIWEDGYLSDIINNTSPAWSLMNVDLTAYADKKVRIAFYHTADRHSGIHSESTGWYIDDVIVIKKVPEFTGDFESGWGDWSADNGVWQVSTPTAGPANCYSGMRCAGTMLDGDYPAYTNSRLISPSITLPEVSGYEEIHLRFWQWFSYSSYDGGYVQISVYDEATQTWSIWEDGYLSDIINNTSPAWSPMNVNLTAYAGKKVRFAFYHTAARHSGIHSESTGWYIDHIRIPGVTNDLCFCDLSEDGQCDGLDWFIFIEDWGRTDCNLPTVECECDLNHDGSCDGRDWLLFIEDWGRTNCLTP